MKPIVAEELETYAKEQTTSPPDLLDELERETYASMEIPHMLTGPLEGRFLKLLVQMLSARRVLEVGMFTGYSALSMAEGVPEGGEVVTCEINPKAIAMARRYFDRSPHGKKIRILEGAAVYTLKTLSPPFDLAFIDAMKTEYPAYYEEALRLLRPGGIVVLDNVLREGNVLHPSDEGTRAINELNRKIASDRRVEAVLLTVRDGVTLARKR